VIVMRTSYIFMRWWW